MAPQPRGWQGHGQLGTGTQMVLPESRGSGHQVVSRKNKYWEKKGPADTGKTLAQDQQGERLKKNQINTQKHWPSPARAWHIGYLWVKMK